MSTLDLSRPLITIYLVKQRSGHIFQKLAILGNGYYLIEYTVLARIKNSPAWISFLKGKQKDRCKGE